MKITILDDYQDVVKDLSCFQLLNKHLVKVITHTEKDYHVLADQLKDTDILVLIRERTEINGKLLQLLPNLKFISQTGKISTHLNLNDCTKYKVLVAEGTGSPIAPAELTWALVMNTVRKIPQAIEGMKQGKWQINLGETIQGKTFGIWGYGKIGQKVAQYAKVFGSDVIVWGSESSKEKALKDGFGAASSKADFFKHSDIISLHLRLNESTFGIVKESDLLRMKKNAVLINTARAELIEKGKLLHCLKLGKPSYAGIDVYEDEPIHDPTYELLQLPNVVCTPHLGYVERNGYELYFRKAFENILNYLDGNPTNIANPEMI